jgi:hypothetical protein
MIYPTENENEMTQYYKILEVAKEIWDSQHGINKARRKEIEGSKSII